jgi:hypothetical protein
MSNETQITPQERMDDSEDYKVAEGSSQIHLEYIEEEIAGLGPIRIHHPSFEISTQLEDYYSQQFNKLLMETDYPTINELEDKLNERGSWTDQDDNQLAKMQDAIRGLSYDLAMAKLQLRDAKQKKQKEKLQAHIDDLNERIITMNARYIKKVTLKTQLFQSTVEKIAERNAQYMKYVKCITDNDDNPIWNSIEEMQQVKTKYLEDLFLKSQRFWSGVEDPLFVQSLDQVDGSLDTEVA